MGKSRNNDLFLLKPSKKILSLEESNKKIVEDIIKSNELQQDIINKLNEILVFANENKLKVTQGKIYSSEKEIDGFKFEGFSRITLIDDKSGKKICIFDDVLSGKISEDITIESLTNLLKGLRYECSRTNKEFNSLFEEVLITNTSLAVSKETGQKVKFNGRGTYNPVFSNAILLSSSSVGKCERVDGEKIFNENTMKRIGDLIAHENAHAYDFKIIGKNKKTGADSIFTKYGKNAKNIGPTKEATEYYNETISTVCEIVHSHHITSDARMSDGSRVGSAFYKKYGRRPKDNVTDAELLYGVWANDSKWKPLVEKATKIMLKRNN